MYSFELGYDTTDYISVRLTLNGRDGSITFIKPYFFLHVYSAKCSVYFVSVYCNPYMSRSDRNVMILCVCVPFVFLVGVLLFYFF